MPTWTQAHACVQPSLRYCLFACQQCAHLPRLSASMRLVHCFVLGFADGKHFHLRCMGAWAFAVGLLILCYACGTVADVGFVVISSDAHSGLERAIKETWGLHTTGVCFVRDAGLLGAAKRLQPLCFPNTTVPDWVVFTAIDTYVYVKRLLKVVHDCCPSRRSFWSSFTA